LVFSILVITTICLSPTPANSAGGQFTTPPSAMRASLPSLSPVPFSTRLAAQFLTLIFSYSGGTVSVFHIQEHGWTRVSADDVKDLHWRFAAGQAHSLERSSANFFL
jgi:hypothetical protein